MEWVLVSKSSHEIVSNYTVSDERGVEAAKFYFIGRKRLSEKRFDELWSVMSKKEYDLGQEAYERKSSSDPSKRWWKEDGYLDIDS
jgi:hypothetical protein